ncbi:hypothetical protein VN23_12020 [Janthinobacterium sp. B9-8]|nr:hypothetical protein VN23_12020 [Janthinobacterium sp. B9-8]
MYQQLVGEGQELFDRCFPFWLAMEAFYPRDKLNKSEQERLRLMIAWANNSTTVLEEIKCLVVLHASSQHPRLQMLPFLRGGELLAGFAEQVLSQLEELNYKYSLTEEAGDLSKQDAAFVLGLSLSQIHECIKTGLFKHISDPTAYVQRIALCDVVHLLVALQAPRVHLGKDKVQLTNHSMAVLAKGILAGRFISMGYDLDKGLSCLRITDTKTLEVLNTDWLNIGQVSTVLGIHQEIIRSFIRNGWLRANCPVAVKSRCLLVHTDTLEQFQAKFVTAGELGRSIQANVTNYAEKLRSIGVSPVGGPGIDGSLVYLFYRADLSGVDLLSLKNLERYETRAGRKKANSAVKKETGVLLKEAAIQLRISPQKISPLIKKGILKRELSFSRNIRVTEESLSALLQLVLSPSMSSLEKVASDIGYTEHRFRCVFIRTGLVELIDLMYWQLVSEAAVNYVVEFVKTWVTASEAGVFFNMHRSYLPNLERQGLIKSSRFGSGKIVKFYSRQDLFDLEKAMKYEANIAL